MEEFGTELSAALGRIDGFFSEILPKTSLGAQGIQELQDAIEDSGVMYDAVEVN
ncbi:MAG: hypothetical protein LBL99_03310 [Holosporaceae bacterium]|nr:hypothetical protein [Holosporaceae bacterium]